ncbi:MAG: type IX secretion system sortase PorU, partial [Candidatus Cloacimonetes bacterium]|nr:type IX secretion system sortase PorU [Candidatus Cloacimonadota bacterium]
VYTYIKLKVTIEGNKSYNSTEATDPATDLFQTKLINAQQAKNWRSTKRYTVNYAPFAQGPWWVRIETSQEGIYRINPSQLSFLNLDDLDPAELRLFSTSGRILDVDSVGGIPNGAQFREVPIQVVGGEDNSFDSGDYILFYGKSRDSWDYNLDVQTDTYFEDVYFNPYSQNQVFWLSAGSGFEGSPLRIAPVYPGPEYADQLVSTRTTVHVESEVQRREDTGFNWYSAGFFGNTTADYDIQMSLDDVDPSKPQKLRMVMIQEPSGNTTTHQIRVRINGGEPLVNPLSGSTIFTWTGSSYSYNFNQNVSGFFSGQNTVRITVLRSGSDNLYFNWLEVDYYQYHTVVNGKKTIDHPQAVNPGTNYRFDLAGSLAGVQIFRVDDIYSVEELPLLGNYFISNGSSRTRYLLMHPSQASSPALVQLAEPEDLIGDNSQRDNIIVTPPEFLNQAHDLAAKYQSTYGLRSRVILQNDIFNQFNGGHPDPAAIRQAMRYFYQNLSAPRISSLTLLGIGTFDWRNFSNQAAPKNKIITFQIGTTSTDDFYGMLNSDQYPELAIGRYPVKNEAELAIMIDKFTSYTADPEPGWWRNSMVFVGDDLNNGDTTYEYYHTQQTQEAAAVLNPSLLIQKIFAVEYEYDEFQNKPAVRNDMFTAINDGRLVWYYVGHGSYDKLGAEDFLNGATDMGRFANSDKLPFFFASSCSVSHYDNWGYESLGQKVVLLENRGAIASYAATRISFPGNNHAMAMLVLKSLANNRNSLGYAIMDGKINYTAGNSNDAVYILFGDPVIRVVPPQRDSTMAVTSSAGGNLLHSRDTASVSGSFIQGQLNGSAELKVFDTKASYSLGPNTTVNHLGNQLFTGSASVSASAYSAGFVVPDDVTTGQTGMVLSYLWDDASKKDYVNYQYPLSLSDDASAVDNPDAPVIQIYLGSEDFYSGDTVGTSTTLLANIADANGINITGAAGHNILMVLDNSLQPVSITDYFRYDQDSYTSGSLSYPLSDLSEGPHTVQVIAFDNFNRPSVASTDFVARAHAGVAIDRLLMYPNPMAKGGEITFSLSMDAEVNINIFTMRGRKIRNIKASGRNGFNSIFFDGRDDRGDFLANNTYFVRVEAKAADGKKTEQTEKLIIFK